MLAYAQATRPLFIAWLFVASLAGAAYLPPSYAVLYMLVKSTWRATTAATAGVLMNLIGLSIGPVLCGLLIDYLTAYSLGQIGHSALASACLHGGSSALADPAQAALCAAANVDATRTALIVFSIGLVWPILHFIRAAQTLRSAHRPHEARDCLTVRVK